METLAKIIGPRKARYSVPDEQVALTVDVTPWLAKKIDAIKRYQAASGEDLTTAKTVVEALEAGGR